MFECAGCDKVLSKDAAREHTKHGGICTTAYPVRHAKDHDKEEKIDELQDEKKKKEEANEEEIKKIEEIKKALMLMSNDELDEELEKLQSEIDDMKKNPDEENKESKSAEFLGVDNHVSKYQVLTLRPYEKETHSGDQLLHRLGSRN